jgi:hypothetical protein
MPPPIPVRRMLDMLAKPVFIRANIGGSVMTVKVMATQLDMSTEGGMPDRFGGTFQKMRLEGIVMEVTGEADEKELLGQQNDISGLLGSLGSRKLTLGEQNAAPEAQEGREDLPNL